MFRRESHIDAECLAKEVVEKFAGHSWSLTVPRFESPLGDVVELLFGFAVRRQLARFRSTSLRKEKNRNKRLHQHIVIINITIN